MAEPITLAEAKQHLRVVVADDDANITGLIVAARQMVEQRTGRALVPREEVLALDSWPDIITLRWPPFFTVDSIEYTDANGIAQTLSVEEYRVNGFAEPARISRPAGGTWPSTIGEEAAIRVNYTAGYDDPAYVPAPLKQWMLLAIGTMYENREMNSAGVQIYSIPEDFMGLLWQPYMVYT